MNEINSLFTRWRTRILQLENDSRTLQYHLQNVLRVIEQNALDANLFTGEIAKISSAATALAQIRKAFDEHEYKQRQNIQQAWSSRERKEPKATE